MRTLLAASALVLSAVAAQAADKPAFRLCTGVDTGNYYRAGHVLKSKASNLNIEVIQTQGSLDNLDKVVGGQCDGAFVQSDALLVYSARNAQALSSIERAGVLYQEQAHLLCNRKAKIGRIVDLTKAHTVAVGPDGNGARTMWDGFVLADKPRYAPVQIDTRSGVRALSAVADGSSVQCMLWVGALNASFMKSDAQAQGDRVVLAGTDDRDMAHTKDARGQAVYSYGEIPADTYPRIQPTGTVYGTKAVGTIAVEALFVTSLAWVNANERPYESLLRAFAAAKPPIETLIKAQ